MPGGPSETPDAAPSWLPSSVGSAARTGSLSADDLHSGSAWRSLLASLEEAGNFVHSDRLPPGGEGDLTGYRHLLVLLALGVDEALRSSDPYEPAISPGNVDNVLKWGMDCPDALYSGAAIRPDAEYRVTGTRGSARFLHFQVMAGMANVGDLVADDLECDDDGRFELYLSAERRPGNWLPLAEGASTLVIRQFFYDWETEDPASLSIECLTPRPAASPERAAAPPEARLARQVAALGEFVRDTLGFWWDIEEAGRAQGLNAFRPPVLRTDIGGASENVTVWGSWDLADDEAMIIEFTPPPALYWSISFGNQWWETIDYAAHQSSLNGHQAQLLDDGRFVGVLSHRDPGLANWLSTGGTRRGAAIVRWVRAESAPVPVTTVVKFDQIGDAVPAESPTCSPAQRTEALAARRRGVRRRFAR
jgi:hypothetical protein